MEDRRIGMKEKTIFNYSALEGKIKEVFDTQENLAAAIPMSRTSLNNKLQNKVDFTSSDIWRIAQLLNISSSELDTYFFKEKVQKTKHSR